MKSSLQFLPVIALENHPKVNAKAGFSKQFEAAADRIARSMRAKDVMTRDGILVTPETTERMAAANISGIPEFWL